MPPNTTRPTVTGFILRVLLGVFAGSCLLLLVFVLWEPGLEVRDGRHDRGKNGIWLAHGWLGGDEWFARYSKTNELGKYRDPESISSLATKLRQHGIQDVFPHLCPAEISGKLPAIDAEQVERFLDTFSDFRVFPWIGGPNGSSARISNVDWRTVFVADIAALLEAHPRFAGVHLNIEPLPSGDKDFLLLLEEIRKVLPETKVLSVAAYPPPTWWHPFPDVHWNEDYFREVARRSDHLAVMMYDAGQKVPKTYRNLMSGWTRQVLQWSEGMPILLGVPTYDDADVEYHDPKVENLENALHGIHRGLSHKPVPTNYQGIAIYCEWEMSEDEWAQLRTEFLKGE